MMKSNDNDGLNFDGTIIMSAFRPHPRVVLEFLDASRTRQEFADETDINLLMKRYQQHGVLPPTMTGEPRYFNAADVPDYQTACNIMIAADEAFMTLPAAVRKEFDNDPAKFVEYAQNPDNVGQMREWGLAEPEKAPDEPMRVIVENAANDDLPVPPADRSAKP